MTTKTKKSTIFRKGGVYMLLTDAKQNYVHSTTASAVVIVLDDVTADISPLYRCVLTDTGKLTFWYLSTTQRREIIGEEP